MKYLYKYILFLMVVFSVFCYESDSFAQTSNLGKIEMNFCNDDQITNEIDSTSKAGENVSICIQFKNTATKALDINVEFVDAVITDDEFNHRACNAPDRAKTQFANFIKTYNHNITLKGGETVKKKYIINYPIGFAGLSHGCVMYNVIGDEEKASDMINVIVRSAKFIDIFVTKGTVAQAVSVSKSPSIKKIGDEYVVSLGIENKGNVDEKLHIISSIYSILGFQKNFIFDEIVSAKTGILLTTKSFLLPVYGGPFLLKSKIIYTPQFNFNITDGKKASEIYVGGKKNIRNILFIWTRGSGILIFIMIFLLIGVVRRRKK